MAQPAQRAAGDSRRRRARRRGAGLRGGAADRAPPALALRRSAVAAAGSRRGGASGAGLSQRAPALRLCDRSSPVAPGDRIAAAGGGSSNRHHPRPSRGGWSLADAGHIGAAQRTRGEDLAIWNDRSSLNFSIGAWGGGLAALFAFTQQRFAAGETLRRPFLVHIVIDFK